MSPRKPLLFPPIKGPRSTHIKIWTFRFFLFAIPFALLGFVLSRAFG